MNKKTYINILFFFFFLLACTPSKKRTDLQTIDIQKIDVKFDFGNFDFKDYFQYDSYLILETTDESLISQIDKIEFFENKIYILDSTMGYILIFDEKGKFLSKLDKKGSANGNYITVDDFIIDQDILYLYDKTLGNILSYDFSGNFINKIKIEKGYSLTKLKTNKWLLYLGNGSGDMNRNFSNLKLYSQESKVLKEFLPFNKHLLGRSYSVEGTKSIFTEYGDNLYILPFLSENIYMYNLEKDELELKYTINFSENSNIDIDENSSESEVKDFREKLNSGLIASRIHSFYKINNMLFFQFYYNHKRHFCLFNEAKVETICVSNRIFDENGLFFEPVVYFSDIKNQDKILSVINGDEFSTCRNIDKKNNNVINTISDSIGNIEDNNPILVWYKLKERKNEKK